MNVDQIDCESDPCHLAWLVRWQTPTIEGENKHRLLDFVQHAECSNGTRMEDLDPNAFIECAVRIKINQKLRSIHLKYKILFLGSQRK